MIQVELAGPRLPKTFEFVPNNVIDMANRIQGTCVQGISYYGGFLTADFPVLRNWIINAETDLNKAFRKPPSPRDKDDLRS